MAIVQFITSTYCLLSDCLHLEPGIQEFPQILREASVSSINIPNVLFIKGLDPYLVWNQYCSWNWWVWVEISPLSPVSTVASSKLLNLSKPYFLHIESKNNNASLMSFLFTYLLIYFWLCWVFTVVRDLLSSCGTRASYCCGLSCCGAQALGCGLQ